jgi:hypothetical protein
VKSLKLEELQEVVRYAEGVAFTCNVVCEGFAAVFFSHQHEKLPLVSIFYETNSLNHEEAIVKMSINSYMQNVEEIFEDDIELHKKNVDAAYEICKRLLKRV